MMKSALLAIALTVPFALSAANPSSGVPLGTVRAEPTTQYNCCYIIIMGRWVCYPC